jgi:hypothetical protein
MIRNRMHWDQADKFFNVGSTPLRHFGRFSTVYAVNQFGYSDWRKGELNWSIRCEDSFDQSSDRLSFSLSGDDSARI